VPPDVTWPLPEPAAGAVPGLKPLVGEELAEPALALADPAGEPGAAGSADCAGSGVRVAVPDGAGFLAA